MGNEAKTENLVREMLREKGCYSNADIMVEEKKSDSPKIDKLLKNASKKGNKQGYPEFIISSKIHSEFMIVIECKAETKHHVSKNLDKYADYAVDGVLLYGAFLSKEFDVLAIAVSGETESTLRISHYLFLHGVSRPVEFPSDDILPFEEYYKKVLNSDIKFRQDYDALLNYSRALNEELRSDVNSGHETFHAANSLA